MKCFTILLLWVSVSHAIQFHCQQTEEGGPTDLRFDSTLPNLIERPGVPLLEPNSVCGQRIKFASDCRVSLVEQEKQYNFSFRCTEVFGDLYFTGLQGGVAQFRCFGDAVPNYYNERTYRQCTVTP